MIRKFLSVATTLGLVTAFGAFLGAPASSAAGVPSGQRMHGQTSFDPVSGHFVGGGGSIEPAYDDVKGTIIYLWTPTKAKVHPNAHNVAPLYLPVYPTGVGIDPAALNCAHIPADNCADHGDGVAGAAQQIMPDVYSGGVAGHDHLGGVASSGGDFNVIWEPVLVLFTSKDAAMQHITTDAQIDAAVNAHQAIEVPLPQLDFNCAIVGASVYNHATPAPTIPTA
jgi:hypothetical protein